MEKVLVVLALVATVTIAVSASPEPKAKYEPRISPEERQRIFDRMREERKIHPACDPDALKKRMKDEPDPGHPMPIAPTSFITNIEYAIEEDGNWGLNKKQKLIYGEEMYDEMIQGGVIKYRLGEGVHFGRPTAEEEHITYSNRNDEALIIITDSACEEDGQTDCHLYKHCKATNIAGMKEEMQHLMGITGDGSFAGASGILQWGSQYGYQYLGMSDCRGGLDAGMECEKYVACIQEDEGDGVASVTYYWSSPDWMVTTDRKQVPMAVEIYATGKFGHHFDRRVVSRYDFFEFYANMRPSPEAIEPPSDVYCKGRKSIYEPPKTPTYFSAETETVMGFDLILPAGDNETQTVHFKTAVTHKEYYDWDNNIASMVYIPWFIFTQDNRYDFITTRIHDFNAGLSYYIKPRLNTCEMRRMENFTNIGDIVIGDDGSVEMINPWAFTHTDVPYQYNGLHYMNDLETDVWIGSAKPQGSLFFNDTYVKYYANELLTFESYDASVPGSVKHRLEHSANIHYRSKDKPEIKSSDKYPVRFEKYRTILEPLPHIITNIFNYQREPPMTHYQDVSKCFEYSSQMVHYVIDFPPNTLNKTIYLRDRFLAAVQANFAYNGKISALRINRLVMEEPTASHSDNNNDQEIRILFTILDTPTVEGDGENSESEYNMKQAADAIRTIVDKGQMVIPVRIKINPITEEPIYTHVVAIAGSMMQVNRDDGANVYTFVTSKGYGSGDMAGLAIGTLILGALVGVAVSMVIAKGKGPNFGLLPRVGRSRADDTNIVNVNMKNDLGTSDI